MPTAVGIIASSSVGAIDPPNVAGLYQWYDASDISTITYVAAPKVSQWRDKSSNVFHLGSASIEPSLIADGLKTGLNSMYFDGTKRIENANGCNQKPLTCFIVVKHTGNAADRTLVGSTFTNGFYWGLTTTHRMVVNQQYIVAIGTSTTAIPANITRILCVTYSATGVLAFYVNNVADGTAIWDVTFNASTAMTSLGDGIGQAFTGTIGEIVKYSSVLSATDRTLVYNYLAAKWL